MAAKGHTTLDGLLVAVRAQALAVGDVAVIKGVPVLLTEHRISVPGKHGHEKSTLKGRDLTTGATTEEVISSCGDVWRVQMDKDGIGCLSDVIDVTGDGEVTIVLEDGETVDCCCPNEMTMAARDALRSDKVVRARTARVASLAGWEYDVFTMGHDTGRGYNLGKGTPREFTAVLDISVTDN